ncbi:EF-hand domain-containing protein [Amaricoccus macauensis]|uniref:EF-hand domain-containing protein n=1 Tax=Amaricoccus macauensis TaxID=57001 RepID=UPI003C7D57C7
MKQPKIIAAGLVALGLAAAGAAIATAQEAVPAEPGQGPRAEMQVKPAHFRGERGDREHGGRDGGRRGHEMFQEIFIQVDADGNGAVTQEEIDTFRANKVAEADTSGDGALSIEEFDTVYRELTRSRMVDAFQRLDADGDGVITDAELDQRFAHVVDRMDRNGDGAISKEDRGRR